MRANEEDIYYMKRKGMVEQQIRSRGIVDEQVLQAMTHVQRHVFVPEETKKYAYEDYPLPIGYQQTISQPYIVGYMTSLLQLKPGYKILEIGTGSGYQTAILAEIVKEVYSIEIIEELAETAQKRLDDLKYKNIFIKHGNGYKGWPEAAPFDGIIVTAAPKEIPNELVSQLKVGGLMIVPIGDFYQDLYVIKKTASGFSKQKVGPVRFVPMVNPKEKF